MADVATYSELATGAGTLVLAIATFASVRSANRSARIAEIALTEQRRPVLVNSRFDDPTQKISFGDEKWVKVPGSSAAVEDDNNVIYLAASVRNVGSGIAVLQGYHVSTLVEVDLSGAAVAPREHPPVEEFRAQSRDLYVAGGDIGLWQAALRDPEAELTIDVRQAIAERRRMLLDLLYTDQLGEQRTISRFGLFPTGDADWRLGASRHWFLDQVNPR
jgi:hypothetical protein